MKKFLLTGTLLTLVAVLTAATITHSDEPAVSDMDIAHIAYTAGNIDIRYAHLALAISETPAVREFAETMIRDHTAVNQKALALLEKLGATPTNNDTSRQLERDAETMRTELMALRGEAFDKRYVANELSYHEFVNGAVESQFIPNAQNEEFKNLLASALRTFKIHEGHARQLNAKVGN